MAKITFDWIIETNDEQERLALENEIVSAFVEGYQGEFIQEVLNGEVMRLPEVTAAEKRAFAVFKLTQQNLSSIQSQRMEKIIMAARIAAQAQAAQHELPQIIRKNDGGR